MPQHTDRTPSNRVRTALVVLATTVATSTALPAEAASAVSTSAEHSSLIAAAESLLSSVGGFLFIFIASVVTLVYNAVMSS